MNFGLILKFISLWKVLRHLSTIMELKRNLESLIQAMRIKDGTAKEKAKLVLDIVEDLLRKGVVDIPNVDEAQLADLLQKLEDKFFPTVQNPPNA